MERDEWEARAFVQEKGALTEPGQQPGNLGNWKGRNVGLASDKLACFCVVLFLRFHYFPPHPLLPLPKKSDSFRGKDTHTHTHTHSIASWDSSFLSKASLAHPWGEA